MQTQTEKETLIAVYGSLKQTYHNHYILDHPDVKFLGETQTQEKYDLWDFGGFPALTENGEQNIVIEVYKTSNQSILDRLNLLEGYRGENDPTNFYDVINITTEFGTAKMYVIKNITKFNVSKMNTNCW